MAQRGVDISIFFNVLLTLYLFIKIQRGLVTITDYIAATHIKAILIRDTRKVSTTIQFREYPLPAYSHITWYATVPRVCVSRRSFPVFSFRFTFPLPPRRKKIKGVRLESTERGPSCLPRLKVDATGGVQIWKQRVSNNSKVLYPDSTVRRCVLFFSLYLYVQS